MARVRDLLVRINGDTGNFEKSMDKAGRQTKSFTQRLDSAKTGSFALLGGLTALTAGVGVLGARAISSAGDFEQYRVAFETMLGSAERAKELMSDISEFAKTTPFELPEVVQGTKQLLAFGFAQEELIPSMRRLGDIASGVGVPVGQLTTVFGQVRIAGRLMGQDLLQFTNAGVPLIAELAKVMGEPQEQIKELVSQGKVGFTEVEQAIINMTKEGSKFGGMMDKQSKTLKGVMSNISDSIGMTMRDLVGMTDTGEIIEGGFFDRVKQAAERLLPILEQIPSVLSSSFEALQPHFPVIIGAILGGLVPAFYSLAAGMWAAFAPLVPFLAAGAAVGFLFQSIAGSAGGVGKVFGSLGTAVNVISRIFKEQLLPRVMAVWEVFANRMLPSLQRLWESFGPQLMPVIKALATILGAVFVVQLMAVWEALRIGIGWLSNLINWIGNAIEWSKKFGYWLGNLAGTIKRKFSEAANNLMQPFKVAFNGIADLWNNTVGQLSFTIPDIKGVPNRGETFSMPKIPKMNTGAENFEGGLAYVHRGEVLANLPPGTDIISRARAKEFGGGGNTTNINFNPTLQVGMFAGMPTEYREISERLWLEFTRIAKKNGIELQPIGVRTQ